MMKFSSQILTRFLSSMLLLGVSTTSPAQNTPGYNTKIPESIMTPNKVETRIGTLEFFDGIPTKKTAALLYDNLDFLRGVAQLPDPPDAIEVWNEMNIDFEWPAGQISPQQYVDEMLSRAANTAQCIKVEKVERE